MDFSNILQYLQGLLTNKQGMQTSEFGQNLGLQNRQLDQSQNQFQQGLDFQKDQFGQTLGFDKDRFAKEFGLNSTIQTGNQQLAREKQANDISLSNRMNVTPGSAQWHQIQQAEANSNPAVMLEKMKEQQAANNEFNQRQEANKPWYLRTPTQYITPNR